MPVQSEVLERLQAMPCLPGNVRLFNWPCEQRPEYEEHYDAYYAATGSIDLWWRASPSRVERAVKRCMQLNCRLHVVSSPPVPQEYEPLCYPLDEYETTLARILDLVNGRIDLSAVILDLEAHKYAAPGIPTSTSVERNDRVATYNRQLYEFTKDDVDYADVPVLRWGHRLVEFKESFSNRGWRADRCTGPHDPVDSSFDLWWYKPTQHFWELEHLRKTIENATQYQATGKPTQGHLWISLGSETPRWLCKGVELFPPLDENPKARHCAVPYDPYYSYRRGLYFSLGGLYEEYIKWITIWPGVFRKGLDATSGVHLCAFLDGLLGRRFDGDLRELQVGSWGYY
jgi:hypothetical protein